MLLISQIVVGFLLSTLIGGIAYQRGSLTRSGWLGAIVTGTLTFGFGGWTWGCTLIIFFVTSSVLSHFRKVQKQQVAGEKFEKDGRRDLLQTLANGGIGAVFALAYGLSGNSPLLLALFAGIMATVTADTWATELGMLSPHPPRMITTLRPVAPGMSGGVSLYGLLASFAGALMIGVVMLLLRAVETSVWMPVLVPVALLGGIAGSLADSLLGATTQAMYSTANDEITERRVDAQGKPLRPLRGWRWMNNDMVNALSSCVGGCVALGIFLLLV